MSDMRAIVITKYGGPEVLKEQRVAVPEAGGDVVVRVRAFGLNHAEAYFRKGVWGEVAKISGIECVGEIHHPGKTTFKRGQRVFALMSGMGRTINGSYAQYVAAPATAVVPIESDLPWTDLAALPESYATAWTFLRHNLDARSGQTLIVRGGTSALGQATINVARELELRVLATTRSREKFNVLKALGAEPLLETPDLSREVRAQIPQGVDAVLDIVGTSTLTDSLKLARYRGHVAMAGFLGSGGPIASFDPMMQLPSGVQLSFFASAFVFGTPDVPLSTIPFQSFVDHATKGTYRAKPAHVFDFDQIVDAHRLMESGDARGKIVVRVPDL